MLIGSYYGYFVLESIWSEWVGTWGLATVQVYNSLF